MQRAACWGIFICLLTGCLDVRSFEGEWAGQVVEEEAVRQGFAAGTRVERLVLSNIELETLSATLTTDDGKFQETPLQRMIKLSNDSLASLTFDGSPMRSYVLFAPLSTENVGQLVLAVVSFFSDDHIELRLLRGNDLFGVFHLQRR